VEEAQQMTDMKRPRNPDRPLVKDEWERKLSNIGVSKVFWKPDFAKLRFKSTQVGAEKLSPEAQRQWVRMLLKDPPRRPPLVVVTSAPTDNGALYLGHFMLQYTLRNGRNAAVLDMADGQPPRFDSYPHTVLLHNILHNATTERIQLVRDVLSRYQFAFRIVVVLAEDNPYRWCVTKLGKYPTMVFHHADFVGAV
jgi:hypothetical protein